jgi:hypothetical protein
LHSKIDGAAAYDVLTNFEERWLRAAKPKGIKKLKSSYDDALLKIERISDILRVSDIPSGDDNPASWHAQVFTQLVLNTTLDSNISKEIVISSRLRYKQNLTNFTDLILLFSKYPFQ